MNKVTFFRATDRNGNTEWMSARVVLPDGRQFHVGYHPSVGRDGQRGGINFAYDGSWKDGVFTECAIGENNSIWLEDRSPDDMFSSEMFADLTGKYPYEVEESIRGNEDYQSMETP